MLHVIQFRRRIQAQRKLDALLFAVLPRYDERHRLARLRAVVETQQIELFVAGQAERSPP